MYVQDNEGVLVFSTPVGSGDALGRTDEFETTSQAA
jgi:hypothetical protein